MRIRRDTAPVTAGQLRMIYERRLANAEGGGTERDAECLEATRGLVRALAEVADDEPVEIAVKGPVTVFALSRTGRVLQEVPLVAPKRARPSNGTEALGGRQERDR
jgi:hypothetical protein